MSIKTQIKAAKIDNAAIINAHDINITFHLTKNIQKDTTPTTATMTNDLVIFSILVFIKKYI